MTSAAQGALAFGVTRVGIFGAASWSVRKSQLKHARCVRGSDAESRMLSVGEFAAPQGLTIRQSLATARAAVRFDALKEQEAHNASMGSLVKFREGAGASMVEDLVSACPGLAGFALQPVLSLSLSLAVLSLTSGGVSDGRDPQMCTAREILPPPSGSHLRPHPAGGWVGCGEGEGSFIIIGIIIFVLL